MKGESRSEHNPIHVSGDGASMKAERLAPLEERVRQLPHQNQSDEGVVSLDTGSLKLPSQLTAEEKSGIFGLEPITFFIIVFALAFIVFIAYLISIEPPKAGEGPAPASVEQQP